MPKKHGKYQYKINEEGIFIKGKLFELQIVMNEKGRISRASFLKPVFIPLSINNVACSQELQEIFLDILGILYSENMVEKYTREYLFEILNLG